MTAVGWLRGDRVVRRSSDAASPNGGAMHWTIVENRAGTAITVGLRARIAGCGFRT